MKIMVVIALLLFGFCSIVYSVEYFSAIDNNVTLFFEQIRLPIATELFLFISDIGSIKYALPICIGIAIFLLYKRKWLDVGLLFLLFFSVRQMNYFLKELFLRERPSYDAVYQATHYSFPSGHSMNSAAIYGFLCYLILSYFVRSNNQKVMTLTLTICLVMLIGVSRIYLGVHYLTDVLAGWSAGFIWLMLFITIKNIFDKKRGFYLKESFR
ncbi:phosphatase [Bacillus sp. UMB0899]|uniref:phosphatase PAP2 family protein n=1 Tax=Metabacillus schmidteae TaxID=2730405 RepID=UPI000C7FCCC2|nr:phosphatase PAP2 family protein [Metabacillus schmidteae]PMC39221.1 phosphatase [Bacillus sp. UMB0899]